MQGIEPARLKTVRHLVFYVALFGLAWIIASAVFRHRLLKQLGLDQAPIPQSPVSWLENSWHALHWTQAAWTDHPSLVLRAWFVASISAAMFSGIILILVHLITRRVPIRRGHGSARWADRSAIEKAGLLDDVCSGTSLIVGGWRDPASSANGPVEYLIHTGPESVAFYAPSGSGKTVAVVIPNLLCYESSAFVLDIKGELWQATAGYRQQELGQRVLYHDPSSDDPAGARFNPLEEIDITSNTAVRDVQMLSEYLIPSSPSKHENIHFEQSARSLLVGVMLFELGKALEQEGKSTNIASVLSQVTSPDRTFSEYLDEMVQCRYGHPAISQAVREIAMEMRTREEREFSGVLSSLVTPLNKFRDPILAHATETSDFKIMDLVEGEPAVTLYLTIRPNERDRLKHYFGLLVNLILRRVTQDIHVDGQSRRELLLMLEEFTSLPALPVVQQSMDVMRGYAVKAFIVLQDIESLIALYGQNETFTSNSKIQVAYTPSKPKTAKLLSEMVGTETVTEMTASHQRKRFSPVSNSESASESVHGRALLTTDEILRLSVPVIDQQYRMTQPGEALIFVRGCPPIRGVQTPYFFDPELLRRSSIAPPERSDRSSDDETATVPINRPVEFDIEQALIDG